MPFWKKDPVQKELYTNIIEGLRQVYKTKLLPLEEAYRFHEFHSSQLDDSDFSAKPMVLLVGQYSVGKTTFIRYLLNVKNFCFFFSSYPEHATIHPQCLFCYTFITTGK